MTELKLGDKAPEFSLLAGDGTSYSLKQFRGRKIVLYFYPEDDTETCTLQACTFKDRYSEITATGAVLLGVSPDSTISHAKFSGKYGLPFPLLSDEQKTVIRSYGVWKKKLMFGRSYMGVVRTTCVTDEHGRIIEIFRNVRLKGHVEKILGALNR